MNRKFFNILVILLVVINTLSWVVHENLGYELLIFLLSIVFLVIITIIFVSKNKKNNSENDIDDTRRSFLWNVVTIMIMITLLNVDSLVITNPGYLLAFRISYILFFVMDFVISIFKRKQSGLIEKIFEPVVNRYYEFSEERQKFIVIGVLIGTIVILSFISSMMLYL